MFGGAGNGDELVDWSHADNNGLPTDYVAKGNGQEILAKNASKLRRVTIFTNRTETKWGTSVVRKVSGKRYSKFAQLQTVPRG